MKILTIANIISWVLFCLIDVVWGIIIGEAFSNGEMHGPFSFFRFVLLCGSLAITVTLSSVVILKWDKLQKDNIVVQSTPLLARRD